jgi:hypothetical protein
MAEKVRANIALDLAAGRGGLERPKDAKPLREMAEAWLERRERTHRSHEHDPRCWARRPLPLRPSHRGARNPRQRPDVRLHAHPHAHLATPPSVRPTVALETATSIEASRSNAAR